MKWAKGEYELRDLSFQEICNSKELYDAIRQDLKRLHAEAGLLGYERVEKFKIDSESWSVDNGLLTPTFKLVRKQLKTRYQGAISELYKSSLYGCLLNHGYGADFRVLLERAFHPSLTCRFSGIVQSRSQWLNVREDQSQNRSRARRLTRIASVSLTLLERS